MLKLFGPLNSGDATSVSDAGDAEADADSNHPVKGTVVRIFLTFDLASLSAPHVLVTTKNAPVVTILEVDADQNGWYVPSTPIHLASDGSVVANKELPGVPIHDFVNVAISNAYNGDNVGVTLMLES